VTPSAANAQDFADDAREHLLNKRYADAEAVLNKGLAAFPNDSGLLHLAGHLALNSGQYAEAVPLLEKALQANNTSAAILLDLGMGYQTVGRLDDAAQCYRSAAQLDSGHIQARANLGFVLRAQGDLIGALEWFHGAIQLDAHHIGAVQGMTSVLGRAITPGYVPMIADMLVQLFHSPYADYGVLAPAAACQLTHLFTIQDDGSMTQQLDGTNTLLKCYLTKCANTDPTLEFALTTARRDQLLSGTPNFALAELLGVQCFINEYVFHQKDDERNQVQSLKSKLESALSTNAQLSEFQDDLILFAMYAPLSDLDGAAKIVHDTYDPELASLVELTLENTIEEQAIKSEIKSFCSVEDETSKKVRGQYEVNPFPRWVHAPIENSVHPGAMLSEMFPYFSPPEFLKEDIRILIAGSGTGQHVAHVALKYPHAKILTFDLSKSSLAYAIRMTRKLGITNVEFRHGDILQAGVLEGPFDIIESIGVLHHMGVPVEGWRVLTSLLREGGMFRCGLYCERGRQGVFAARDIIARESIGDSAEEIAAFRQRIYFDPPPGDFTRIKERADFYTTSNVRDLLFHVQEDNYTPKRLHDEITELGLTFVGFEEFEDHGINDEYRNMFPSDAALSNLLNWEEFEKSQEEPMEGYVFWCQKLAV